MSYLNKYNLTQEENLFLAKKMLVENIYNQVRMENINITFSDTKTIIDGMSVSGLKTDDVQKVLNLRNAWKFVLDDISVLFNLSYFQQIHRIIAYGELLPGMLGTLRTGEVGIGGSFYSPKVPEENTVIELIDTMLTTDRSETEKALDYFLTACCSQFFWDGNKRTASICMNRLMIQAGVGIMIVQEKQLRRFNKLMIDFYETADRQKIKRFLYDHCIYGLTV
ncbi:hypothetical protein NRIC_21420 [Enterococcus florum]|uniref:Fido domain-containing protein n=1 Tax=Enterococcus florum TaxID=2480627 RepID=A0A4P5PD40_9ENTE|nr:Fic family protein [Enterococcus florum]GCF94251.1 hypothetical protein NRIC_21420 [Enterococcus florum]